MTITAFDIYLVSLADKIVDPAGCIAVAAFVFSIFVVFIMLLGCDTQEEIKKNEKRIKTALCDSGCLWFTCNFYSFKQNDCSNVCASSNSQQRAYTKLHRQCA